MIEIVICLIIWCWGLTPLWLNILLTILLFVRFSWRLLLTITKVFKLNKELEDMANKKYEVEMKENV